MQKSKSLTTSKKTISTKELIAPCFYEDWIDIKEGKYSEIEELGGRGSTKSSFIALAIVYNMMRDRQYGRYTHAVALRRYNKDVANSVFRNIGWAIEKLGVSHLWKRKLTPPRWYYMPKSRYPQEIQCLGADDPSKIKSIKFTYGYAAYLWFEEKDQFRSCDDITSIKLSVARKNDDRDDDKFLLISSYNPPQIPTHWVNIDAKRKKAFRKTTHSTYLQVPPKWISKEFMEEAEFTKETNTNKYNHVFLGEVTGVEGLVYPMFDINKHTTSLKDFKWFINEKIVRIICGCDGGTINDATTLIPMLLTTAGRIVAMPTFYYDPQEYNHQPLAPSIQVKLMEDWLDLWSKRILNTTKSELVTVVVDSAAQDLVLEFNLRTKYAAMPVPGKDILLDMKRHQNVLTAPDYFLLINEGYYDPVTMNKIDDNDMYIQEIVALTVDDKGKPMDGNNHSIDGINYGLKVATQIV